ncbi:exo-beta-N-acetylmuramidase NamZ family protein [Alteromonas gilva]|uniref:DUF1343 domain-containing protein n=1 Tax=Alteromonas gilva TaxID=2987522 RepID=A0ABT5L5P6_9ALTE|nr:DUF1343 domain-containing protein [Alteromonas gilva]MDC8832198.1 DUF1343 domain-containing protein [Alteromonas gilva]
MISRICLTVFILFVSALQTVQATITVAAEQPERYLPLLQGQRVGLVVNQTSRAHSLHLVDFLISKHIAVQAVFAPEHGFRGKLGAGEKVTDGKDPKTGLPIRSLYGKHKKPSPDMLADIDVLVFDIQDVGARFYTYISTLHYVMEAAAEQHIPLIVLDRPNPNGRFVDGPVRDPEFASFVGLDPIPLLHGMTVAELARMIKGEGWINAAQDLSLTVIPVAQYNRSMHYPLPIAPSPNLPNHHAVRLYPSLCLFEATVVSVGRGTPWPFQVIGFDELPLGEFHFTPRPMPESAPNPKLEGELLYGALLQDSDIEGFDITLLHRVFTQFRQAGIPLIDRPDFFDLLSGTDRLRQQLESGMSAADIRASWQADLTAFKTRRQPYLLYP